MPEKLGNGGHSQEQYDPNTGKYVVDGVPNKYYDNPDESKIIGGKRDLITSGISKAINGLSDEELDALDFEDDEEADSSWDSVRGSVSQNDVDFAEKHNIKLIEGDHSIEDDIKVVNPNYRFGSTDYRENCACCSVCYEMRRRGLDVEAQKKNDLRTMVTLFHFLTKKEYDDFVRNYMEASFKGYSGSAQKWGYSNLKVISSMFKNPDGTNVVLTSIGDSTRDRKVAAQKIKDLILKEGEGARFMFSVVWEGMRGGHAFNAEVKNGEVIIVDSQINETFNFERGTEKYFDRAKIYSISFARVDDKILSDEMFEYYSDLKGAQRIIYTGDLAYKRR